MVVEAWCEWWQPAGSLMIVMRFSCSFFLFHGSLRRPVHSQAGTSACMPRAALLRRHKHLLPHLLSSFSTSRALLKAIPFLLLFLIGRAVHLIFTSSSFIFIFIFIFIFVFIFIFRIRFHLRWFVFVSFSFSTRPGPAIAALIRLWTNLIVHG